MDPTTTNNSKNTSSLMHKKNPELVSNMHKIMNSEFRKDHGVCDKYRGETEGEDGKCKWKINRRRFTSW